MKKHSTCIILLATTFSLFGAAGIEPAKIVEEIFEDAKLAIATGRPGALDGLSDKIVCENREKVKQLLEYAMRSGYNNGNAYVLQLVNLLQLQPEAGSLPSGRARSSTSRASESLTLLDIAIMKGNVMHVTELLKLKPDLSVSRLISDRRIVSTQEALTVLIDRMKKNETVYSGHRIDATFDQLQQIEILVQAHMFERKKRSISLPAIFRKKK